MASLHSIFVPSLVDFCTTNSWCCLCNLQLEVCKGSLVSWAWVEPRKDLTHLLKVSKSQKQNWWKKLLPKMKGRICFCILTVRIYLKLEIEISSFRWFRTVRIEKQICPFGFGRSFFRQFSFWDLLTFSKVSTIWLPCATQISYIGPEQQRCTY